MIRIRLLLAIAGSIGATAVAAPPSGDATPPASAQDAEKGRALRTLDLAIGRFSALVDAIGDEQAKTTNKGFLDDFTRRSLALRQTYDQIACNDLRLDLGIESQRLIVWLTTQFMRMPVGQAERAADLAIYFIRPSPDNAEEMKAAFDALDREIERLEQRKGPPLQRIREHRAKLGLGYSKERWDALIADIKDRWKEALR